MPKVGEAYGTIEWSDRSYPLSRPGCWAYPDMMQIGNFKGEEPTRSYEEQTHFGLWSIISSPLVLGFDMYVTTLSPPPSLSSHPPLSFFWSTRVVLHCPPPPPSLYGAWSTSSHQHPLLEFGTSYLCYGLYVLLTSLSMLRH